MDQTYLKEIIEAYKTDIDFTEDDLENAKRLFKAIKEDEKTRKDFVPKDQQPELYWAKYDLKRLGEDCTDLTKNQIYLKHQSVMINKMYMELKGKK